VLLELRYMHDRVNLAGRRQIQFISHTASTLQNFKEAIILE
jgi:hypothetical protein